MGELAERRTNTAARINELRDNLKSAEAIANNKACVYATGSFGRREAGTFSDLDLFIVGRNDGKPNEYGIEGSKLSQLDEILVKAALIELTRTLGIPEFSGDGRYLVHYSAHEFTKTLGTRDDDVTNTFTARVLLLLESCPLIGNAVYDCVIREVIAAYWRDYEDHKVEFMPAFLANDILRLWRTFCVNYEAGTATEPEAAKVKRKIKNYKLKHSRLLTCYSALLYMLAIFKRQKTISPEDAMDMIGLSPTERLEWLGQQSDFVSAHKIVARLLEQYERFLAATNVCESDLMERFSHKAVSREHMNAAYKFGDLMFDALKLVGDGSNFYRLLVV